MLGSWVSIRWIVSSQSSLAGHTLAFKCLILYQASYFPSIYLTHSAYYFKQHFAFFTRIYFVSFRSRRLRQVCRRSTGFVSQSFTILPMLEINLYFDCCVAAPLLNQVVRRNKQRRELGICTWPVASKARSRQSLTPLIPLPSLSSLRTKPKNGDQMVSRLISQVPAKVCLTIWEYRLHTTVHIY
jgi:hypothetical protein